MTTYFSSTTYYKKRLSELTEEEALDFYKHLSNTEQQLLLLSDCKRLHNLIDRITEKLSIKVHFWEFWKPKCPFCNHLMLGGRTLHCGRYECNEEYQRLKKAYWQIG